MKKILILTAMLVLTLVALAACGCRNSRPATMPTTMPAVTTMPTEVTTVPTTMATLPSTEPTLEDGNGPVSTDATTGTEDAQSRMVPGSGNGITGSITG